MVNMKPLTEGEKIMKTSTLLIGTVLLAGFAGSTFAQGYHHHHYRGSDGVVLAAQIVDLVKTVITPPVVVTSPAVVYPVAEPVVYTAPVYTAPVYCAPPPPPRRYHHHPAPPPPPRGRCHGGPRHHR